MTRVISAESLPQYRLKVTFNDGVSGVFPVEPERRGGVFLKLLNARVFNAVSVNPDFGCVEWPGGVDLCPEAMHQVMTGSESEAELQSAATLREDAKRNQQGKQPPGAFFNAKAVSRQRAREMRQALGVSAPWRLGVKIPFPSDSPFVMSGHEYKCRCATRAHWVFLICLATRAS